MDIADRCKLQGGKKESLIRQTTTRLSRSDAGKLRKGISKIVPETPHPFPFSLFPFPFSLFPFPQTVGISDFRFQISDLTLVTSYIITKSNAKTVATLFSDAIYDLDLASRISSQKQSVTQDGAAQVNATSRSCIKSD